MKTARILCRENFGLGVLLLLLLTSYVHQMDRQLLVRSTDGDAFNLKFRFRARRWHCTCLKCLIKKLFLSLRMVPVKVTVAVDCREMSPRYFYPIISYAPTIQ